MYQELLEKRMVKKEALAWEVSFRSSLLFHFIYIYARPRKKVAGVGSVPARGRETTEGLALHLGQKIKPHKSQYLSDYLTRGLAVVKQVKGVRS